MKLIDTHAHLSDPRLSDSLGDIKIEMAQNNIDRVISIGCSIKESKESIALSAKNDWIYATAGLYPHDNGDEPEKLLTTKERLSSIELLASKNPKVVAIGECGLDYTKPPPSEIQRSKKGQQMLFRAQIQLAKKLKLPVIIHSREATSDTLKILKEERSKGNFKAVWHCFTETQEVAQNLLDLGFHISITGIVTYRSGQELRKVIKEFPLEKIMLETDSPYLVPQQARTEGAKINTPAYVKLIASEIADIKGLSIDEVARVTTQTANIFFNLDD